MAVRRVKNVFVDQEIVPKEGQLEDENWINLPPEVEGQGLIDLELHVFEKPAHYANLRQARTTEQNETNQTRPSE